MCSCVNHLSPPIRQYYLDCLLYVFMYISLI